MTEIDKMVHLKLSAIQGLVNNGRDWHLQGHLIEVDAHDFSPKDSNQRLMFKKDTWRSIVKTTSFQEEKGDVN